MGYGERGTGNGNGENGGRQLSLSVFLISSQAFGDAVPTDSVPHRADQKRARTPDHHQIESPAFFFPSDKHFSTHHNLDILPASPRRLL